MRGLVLCLLSGMSFSLCLQPAVVVRRSGGRCVILSVKKGVGLSVVTVRTRDCTVLNLLLSVEYVKLRGDICLNRMSGDCNELAVSACSDLRWLTQCSISGMHLLWGESGEYAHLLHPV